MVGRIRDRLVQELGDDSVFMDVESVPGAVDFRTALRRAVESCDIMLVIIGPTWQRAWSADDVRESTDWLQTEIELGLASEVVSVLPVVVGDTPVPEPHELPVPVRQLAYLQAARVRGDPDFRTDVDRMLMRSPFRRRRYGRSRMLPPAAIGVVGAGAMALTALVLWYGPGSDGGPDSTLGLRDVDVARTAVAENRVVATAGSVSVDSTQPSVDEVDSLPLDGAVLWLDASDASTVRTDDRGRVQSWLDKSSSGWDFDVVSGDVESGNRFLDGRSLIDVEGGYVAARVNGLDVGEFTAFVVLQKDPNADVRNGRIFSGSSGSSDWWSNNGVALTQGGGTGLRVERREEGVFLRQFNTTSARVLAVRVTDRSSEIIAEGEHVGSAVNASHDWGNATELFLMGRDDEPGTNGYLAEVIVFPNALSDNEIESVGTYLSKKWGLEWESGQE